MGCALLAFDFYCGDLVRWLEREYTNSHRDFSALREMYDRIAMFDQRPRYPRLDYDRAPRAMCFGVPFIPFQCHLHDMLRRLKYDNHAPVKANVSDVRATFAEEEANSYHIAFPPDLALFVYGLFILPISWVVQKGKGRPVIDASNTLGPNDSGAPNALIPAAGALGREDECPKVFYGIIFARHLTHIWNLRISHTREDPLQHTDDISNAFRQLLYHPNVAIAFAYVFEEFLLLIPVGMTFGARSSPSWWCFCLRRFEHTQLRYTRTIRALLSNWLIQFAYLKHQARTMSFSLSRQ
jgi:hypothetical protein